MSKSLKRVAEAIAQAGLDAEILNPGPSRTADEAAAACGCGLDQIVKSLIFQGPGGAIYLFLTAGGNRLDPDKASALAGETLERADANTVR
ncbi:MAG: YbaK/EbsC family protein, partial [Rhodobacteraceae bacterium]|nr:YbaK/EbsC family protein [Paracoccaceae bacterium]